MSKTGIQWTDQTWNPVTGCTKVSPGCANCYASELHNKRFKANNTYAMQVVGVVEAGDERHIRPDEGWPQYVKRVGPPSGQTWAQRARELGVKLPMAAPCYDVPFATVTCHEDRLREPLRWKKPQRVFTCSMADLFHADVPDSFLDRVFAVMALTPHITYQVLTKRPDRAREYLQSRRFTEGEERIVAEAYGMCKPHGPMDWDEADGRGWPWPLPNVWLGTSVENQEQAERRIPELLLTPAAVRFLSCEPLLERVNLVGLDVWRRGDGLDGESWDQEPVRPGHMELGTRNSERGTRIDWVIVGGESGSRAEARPFDVAWARDIIAQCRSAGVAVFVKQFGRNPYEVRHALTEPGPGAPRGLLATTVPATVPIALKDRDGGNWDEWPADLRVREWPGGSSEFQVPSSAEGVVS